MTLYRKIAQTVPLRLTRWLGWSGCAMVLGNLPVPGRPTNLITVGQGPTALAVGAGGGCLDIFTLICPFFLLSPSLWETARYRLKYCLKGPLNPKPTNQPTNKMAARAKNRKTFKRLLLLNQIMDFEIILQEGSLGDPLPKLLKHFRSVEQDGRQS